MITKLESGAAGSTTGAPHPRTNLTPRTHGSSIKDGLKILLAWLLCLGMPWAHAQISPISRFDVAASFQPMELVSGPDGQLWFSGRTIATPGNTRLVKMGLDGSLLASYDLNPLTALPTRLAAGPDGHLWANTWDNTITRIDPGSGQLQVFAMPSILGTSGASGITTGPDGNVWMLMPRGLARITPQGQVTAFSVDTTGSYFGLSSGLINGPGGQLWFGNLYDPWQLHHLAPGTGSTVSTDISTLSFGAQTLASGPDGQVWFLPSGYQAIDKFDPASQQITAYPIRTNAPNGLTVGPDQDLWYVTSSYYMNNVIGRITPQGLVTEYPLPAGTKASSITVGPDNHFWYVENHQDPSTQDDVYNIATFALPSAVPQCSASPVQGFSSTAVTFSCTGLGSGGQLSLQGGSCTTPLNGLAQCTAALGATDGTVVFTDAQGLLAYMPHRLSQVSEAYCFASPDQAFAGTVIALNCQGLPSGATLTIAGAVCQAPQNDGTVSCQGILGSGPTRLADQPQAQTRLADGTVGSNTVWLNTLVVHCSANPHDAQIGDQITILCPDAPDNSTVTINGAQCSLATGIGATCTGIAGTGPSDLRANPSASITFLGVVGTSAVALDIQSATNPGDGSIAAAPIPTLDLSGLALTTLLLAGLGGLRAGSRLRHLTR